MPGSTLQGDRVVPAFKPPFDIIRRIAEEARACESGRSAHKDIKEQAEEVSSACPTLVPLLDELRTYCYEHAIEEIPSFLTA